MSDGIFITWHKSYCHPLPEGHRFPMIKYDLLREQLLREGIIQSDTIITAQPASSEEITAVHCAEYVQRLDQAQLSRQELRAIGFPYSASLWIREKLIAGGTLQAAEIALKKGVAFNTAGGTHHAGRNFGGGFCLLNDQAVAAKALIRSGKIKKALLLDLDVHQGNGSADIFKNDPSAFTLSFHGRNNYPLQKVNSDLDVPLEDGISDEQYHQKMQAVIPDVIKSFKPDMIFYQAGVDVLATDKLGKLKLSREGCRKRDHLVLSWCRDAEIPVTVTMGGGYSEDIRDVLEAHVNTYRVAAQLF